MYVKIQILEIKIYLPSIPNNLPHQERMSVFDQV